MGCPKLDPADYAWEPRLRLYVPKPALPRTVRRQWHRQPPPLKLYQPWYCSIGVNSNFTQQDIASTGATTTVVFPTGTTATDVMVAVFTSDWATGHTAQTTTPPAGWTAISAAFTAAPGNTVQLGAYWALGGNATNGFANTQTGAAYQQGVLCFGFTGVDNVTPIDATGTTNSSTGSASLTANAVTVATLNAWHCIANASWNSGTVTATSFTVDQNGAIPPASNADATFLYNTTPKAVGSTGTVVINNSASATGQIILAMPFALRPAAAAAAAPWGWDAAYPDRAGRPLRLIAF